MEKRISVIEHYEKKGLLDSVKSKWTAEDRRKVGIRLSEDFYRAKLEQITAIDYSKDRVDISVKAEPDYLLDARDRFNKAIQAIPQDFYKVVSDVCCHNRLIKGRGITKQQKLYDRYMQICDLCRGLDYLIRFYLGIGKKA